MNSVLLVSVVAGTLLVLVLQLVILVRIDRFAKRQPSAPARRDGHPGRSSSNEDAGSRRRRFEPGREQMRDRKPEQGRDNRSKPQQEPAVLASVEKAPDSIDSSLRDINLKLKNAEKSQETARRQVREGTSENDGPDRNRQGSRRRGGRNRRPRQEREGNERPSHQQTEVRRESSSPREEGDVREGGGAALQDDAVKPVVNVTRRVLEGTETFGSSRTSGAAPENERGEKTVAAVPVAAIRSEPPAVPQPRATEQPKEPPAPAAPAPASATPDAGSISFGRR